ncbi:MAG: Maf family nucleotide pyrophosphatase, partial [Gammaproteobacteria bacterium]|nr:Maf family nucleotide pyrophosphatase [Gammaproteobacteria bacterium]
MKLVLASTSPFRHELLSRLGQAFETAAPDSDESRFDNEPADKMVLRLAEKKARSIADKFPKALIIGSDQVATVDDLILGKPGTHEKAVQQLQHVSGKSVLFHTGLCLLNSETDQAQRVWVPFEVTFRSLSDQQIESYLLKEKPYNCAGSFKSEALGITLFEKLSGDDPSA